MFYFIILGIMQTFEIRRVHIKIWILGLELCSADQFPHGNTWLEVNGHPTSFGQDLSFLHHMVLTFVLLLTDIPSNASQVIKCTAPELKPYVRLGAEGLS